MGQRILVVDRRNKNEQHHQDEGKSSSRGEDKDIPVRHPDRGRGRQSAVKPPLRPW
jgi:hypothetical protein